MPSARSAVKPGLATSWRRRRRICGYRRHRSSSRAGNGTVATEAALAGGEAEARAAGGGLTEEHESATSLFSCTSRPRCSRPTTLDCRQSRTVSSARPSPQSDARSGPISLNAAWLCSLNMVSLHPGGANDRNVLRCALRLIRVWKHDNYV